MLLPPSLSDMGDHSIKHKEVGYMDLLKIKRYSFAATTGALGYFVYSYMEPILAFRLAQF